VLRKKLALLVAAAMMLASMLAFASVASAATYHSATATATASAASSASTSASAAGAAQYQYTSASALPGTGGVVSPATLLAIVPAILLVGGGLLSAARLLGRS
jgi:hypothetical protein